MKSINTSLIIIFSVITFFPFNGNCDSGIPVAKIIIPDHSSPEDCYELIHRGETVKPLFLDMEVYNGDIIIPHNGKTVKLIYRQTGCLETEIKDKTTVNCNPVDQKDIGGFVSYLADIAKGMKESLAPETRPIKEASTTRGNSGENQSCFPNTAFDFSPWPINGTTALYKKPLFFRWINDDLKKNNPCSPATLIITDSESKTNALISQEIKLGEFVHIPGDIFKPGSSYTWYIERSGMRISEPYSFRVLPEQATTNITMQLDEVRQVFPDNNPEVMQAIYLQIISDASTEIDLYANSLQILMEVKGQNEKTFSKALDGIRQHLNLNPLNGPAGME